MLKTLVSLCGLEMIELALERAFRATELDKCVTCLVLPLQGKENG